MSVESEIRKELDDLKQKYGLVLPDRRISNDPNIPWRYKSKPDYLLADLEYLKGKTMNHAAGSLELLVENLVKCWEMESNHITDPKYWTTISQEKYTAQANGGKEFSATECEKIGSYNWLMWDCAIEVYDSTKEDYESSKTYFKSAFPRGFPWEVLHVYTGPPTVSFSWRHWAHFTGQYQACKGQGQLVEMYGFCIVELDKSNKIMKVQVYYKPEEFIKTLGGKNVPSGSEMFLGPACPYVQRQKQA